MDRDKITHQKKFEIKALLEVIRLKSTTNCTGVKCVTKIRFWFLNKIETGFTIIKFSRTG